VEVKAGCAASVTQDGETTLPARKLADICRNLAEGSEIRFRLSDERCVVTAGRARFSLGVLPAADFPLMDADVDGVGVRLAEGVLRRILDKTSFAMAQQDVRYYLNGLLIELDDSGITAVGTDGHRLARYRRSLELDVREAVQVIVPSKTVMELRRQLGPSDDEVSIAIGARTIRLAGSGMAMTSKLVDGRYPDYERVIPHELGKVATLSTDALRRALARTAILSNEKHRGVRLAFEEGVLRLQAHNPEQEEAEEEVELDYRGEPTAIGFNVTYLSDVLGAVEGEELEVRFHDAGSSSVWRGLGADDETYVVMPMRL